MGHWQVFIQYDRIPGINKLRRGKMYFISNLGIIVDSPCSVASRAIVKLYHGAGNRWQGCSPHGDRKQSK